MRRRDGQLLGPVLLFLAMLAVLSYSVQGMMVEYHAMSHRLALESGAHALALSGLAAGAARVRTELAPGGGLRDRLAGGTLDEGPLPLDLTNEIALLTADYPGSSLAVTVRVGKRTTLTGKKLDDADERARLRKGRGWDPEEVRFPVTLEAEARWGRVTRQLTEVREGAMVDAAPGTFGKFTLWAKNLRPADPNGFSADFEGRPAEGARAKPLVLHNGGAAPAEPFTRDPNAYQRRGHVYLGGDPALNVTAGYFGFGEVWTFLPIEELAALALGSEADRSPPVYVDADPPDFFLRNYPPPDSAGPPFQRFEIRHMMAGFWTGADAKGRKLAEVFPGEAAATGASFGGSSRLHLFGTAEEPSPTLVLGRVRRRCPALTAVLVDAEEDGTPDGLVGILPQLDGEFPAGMPKVPAVAAALKDGAGVKIDNEADVTWENMFTSETYGTFASQIEDRPYMEAYSFLYRQDEAKKSFYPEPPLFPGFVEDLTLGESSDPFYSGRPEDLAAGDLLEKATHSVATVEELKERFVTNGRMFTLDSVVEVRKAPGGVLKLADLKVMARGTIVLSGPGDIEVSGLSFDRAGGARLTVVAMNGNVKLERDDAGDPLPISVIAPRGRLKVAGTGRLALEGSLVVETLDLDELAEGGDLYHDPDLDPVSAARRERYRVLFSDAALAW